MHLSEFPSIRSLKSAILAVLLALAGTVWASDVVEVAPVNNRIVMVHFKDGYVIHHKIGQRREDETVVQNPLNVVAASLSGSYSISSTQDPAYLGGKAPLSIGRKSKGTDFAWHIDRWVVDHVENDAPDHTDEHWIYLFVPSPLKAGETYQIGTRDLGANGKVWKVIFDPRTARSESVHVNIMGYAPADPAKFGYVYHWAGDKGGIDFKPYLGNRFWLVNQATGKDDFEGRLAFRDPAGNVETGDVTDTPNGNFLGADVYQCDFSSFKHPGKYVLAVEGVGCSFPFKLDPDVYREPFRTVARGLFQNRSGIILTKPFTSYDRPAPHHPGITPGFKLEYSSLPYLDYGSESGTKEMIEPTLKGPLDAWGWYQDAGDWDSYPTHLKVAQDLMLAFELNPKAFKDGELNIPESGDGIPDILDEATWCPRFCQRLRAELMAKHYGTGGLGLRVDGDPFGSDTKPNDVGQGSWQDVNRLWVASGEDPVSTFEYAGVAAQLSHCLAIVGKPDPKGINWLKEARESYAWALAHTRTKDENEVRTHREYAAAALFRATGDKSFESELARDAKDAPLWGDELYAPALYVMGGAHDSARDPVLLRRLTKAILDTAELSDQSASHRALRWAGDWGMPMLIGQQTTPMILEVAVARAIVKDPVAKERFTKDLYTTCDYFLGTNALNMTWTTGLGVRHPNMVFHMDSWYTGDGSAHSGIVPYGPWRKERAQGVGPWDHDWVNKTVYPAIDQWPGNERWFDDRCCPLTGEFTIHQNTAPSAAIFGVLCAASK
jgi:endoglucanase